MLRIRTERLTLFVLFAILGVFLSIGTIVPRTVTGVFASPDETAVALFANGWTRAEGFQIQTGIPEVIANIAGLHPRSMVQQGDALVPVGFLGMSLLALPFEHRWQGSAAFLTALLVASSIFPLWQFANRIGRRAALVASAVYLSFPVVLLYANRGLFPNLPVVALGLWSVWLVGEKETWKRSVGGFLLGCALAIRPIEGVWLIPWVVWGCLHQRNRKEMIRWRAAIPMICATVCVPLIAYIASVQTYQSVIPTIGYWLRDTVHMAAPLQGEVPVHVTNIQPTHVLPFGIHPRTLQLNIRTFWLEMLWPWVLLACAGLVQLWWHGRITWKSPVAWLVVWTGVVLGVLYGQVMYLDNIRGTPALGNSFLRYMLPLVPLIAIAIGAWVEWVSCNMRRTIGAGIVVICLGCYGIGMGLVGDEESILATQTELHRYTHIRAEAARLFDPGTIVISERSDKIFAGLPGIVAVSPLPREEDIQNVLRANVPVFLFHRILTEEERAQGLSLIGPMYTNQNEGLYRIQLSTIE